jgi:hypothetical protein
MFLPKTNLQKTLSFIFFSSLASALVCFCVQNTANKSAGPCSYLDPITIDIMALIAGLFLILEGLRDVLAHRECKVSAQLGRAVRICLGTGILTIHIMQFIHK